MEGKAKGKLVKVPFENVIGQNDLDMISYTESTSGQ